MKRWIMALAWVCTFGMSAFAQKATEASIIVFGEAKATKERIDKGATFIDGRFLRGPYTVTRQGNVIFVNGQPATYLKVEVAKEDPEADEAPASEADAEPADEATDADASETTEAEPADVALPPTRTLTRAEKDAAAKEKADAMFKRSGHKSLKEKEAERKKAATAKPKPAFNQEASSSNPEALFEEADYTFTPPKKAEPKAVPYVRPSTTKSLKERLAEEAAAEAAEQAEQAATKTPATPATPAEEDTPEASDEALAEEPTDLESEAIGMLSEDEAKRYIDELKKRHKAIEEALQKDQLVFLSSSAWGWKVSPKAVMQKFILSLEKPGKWEAFSKQWKSLPQQYLRKIYDQRDENSKNSKALRLKIQRGQREAKDKPSRV